MQQCHLSTKIFGFWGLLPKNTLIRLWNPSASLMGMQMSFYKFHLVSTPVFKKVKFFYSDCVKRIWYLLPMRAAKVQASLRIRAVSPEPPLLAHTSSESRGTFRQKARSLAPLNGWACAVEICHDGMLEDTNSLDGAHLLSHPCAAL